MLSHLPSPTSTFLLTLRIAFQWELPGFPFKETFDTMLLSCRDGSVDEASAAWVWRPCKCRVWWTTCNHSAQEADKETLGKSRVQSRHQTSASGFHMHMHADPHTHAYDYTHTPHTKSLLSSCPVFINLQQHCTWLLGNTNITDIPLGSKKLTYKTFKCSQKNCEGIKSILEKNIKGLAFNNLTACFL